MPGGPNYKRNRFKSVHQFARVRSPVESSLMRIQWFTRTLAGLGVVVSVAAAGQSSTPASTLVPAQVTQALRAAGIPASHVAIVVQDVSATRPLLAVNEDVAMNPASTMKLVTTYAGLDLLGPAYRWRTETYLNGALREGTLAGDLVVKGYGDPKLTLEAFWMLLRDLRARGLQEIRGDLVLDRSYFSTSLHDPAQFDGAALRPYNVGPDALLVNFKSIRLRFLPDVSSGSARVSAEPPIVDVVNVVRVVDGACGDWRERLTPTFQAQAAAPRVVFTGSYAAACGERDWHVALLEPTPYVNALFRLLWGELGGTLSGITREGASSPDARPYATLESLSLAEIVRDINKYSNNVMARQLLLTIAAEQGGAPGTEEKGQRAIKSWLAAKGLPIPELVMENGAGLSRVERISARSLTTLLVAAYRSPVMPELMASMPLVAMDGTMRRRMKGASIAGQAHIKTGSLADTRAIAGYVLDRAGRRYAVTMIVNHPNAQLAQAAQDTLLNWVYELN